MRPFGYLLGRAVDLGRQLVVEVRREIPPQALRRRKHAVRPGRRAVVGAGRRFRQLVSGLGPPLDRIPPQPRRLRVGSLTQLARPHGFDHRAVRVQQPLRHPAAALHVREGLLDDAGQLRHRPLYLRRLPREAKRRRLPLPAGDGIRCFDQFVDADLRPCRARHDGHAQLALEPGRVDRDPVPLRFVDQVEEDHHLPGDVQNLQGQVQVALEAGGVHDDDRYVGPPEQDEIARHLLVDAARLQRVGTRQVNDLHARSAVGEYALGARNRLAGPVAGVLPQSRQRVEDRALADVRVAGQGDQKVPPVGAEAQTEQVLVAAGGAAVAGGGWQGH